jgi:hypothetical protein
MYLRPAVSPPLNGSGVIRVLLGSGSKLEIQSERRNTMRSSLSVNKAQHSLLRHPLSQLS